MKIKIDDLNDLDKLAKLICKSSFKGMFIGLIGELGSGKTQFVKFLVKNFNGSIEDVVSPTFTILNEYNTPKFKVYHFDLYRLNSIEELEDIGYKDFFFDDEAIKVVEWMDRIREAIPDEYLLLRFEFDDNNEKSRFIEVKASGEKYKIVENLIKEKFRWH